MKRQKSVARDAFIILSLHSNSNLHLREVESVNQADQSVGTYTMSLETGFIVNTTIDHTVIGFTLHWLDEEKNVRITQGNRSFSFLNQLLRCPILDR